MIETLLEKCQRECEEVLYAENFNMPHQECLRLYESMNQQIANTLKQAAEALEGLEKKDLPSALKDPAGFCKGIGYNQALTDAQKLLLGEDNDNV